MIRKNTFRTGLLWALVLPLLGFGLFFGLFNLLEQLGAVSEAGFRPLFRERTSALVGIALNAVLMNYYNRLRFTEAMRGVVVPTVLYVVVWVILFGKTVF